MQRTRNSSVAQASVGGAPPDVTLESAAEIANGEAEKPTWYWIRFDGLAAIIAALVGYAAARLGRAAMPGGFKRSENEIQSSQPHKIWSFF